MNSIKYESKASSIARYLLAIEPMSQKKLHKMLYFCYVYYLLLNNNDIEQLNDQLFPNRFEAWIHGPVYAPLYTKYKDYGFQLIEIIEDKIPDISEKAMNAVYFVLEHYGDFSSSELEDISHNEEAWLQARGDIGRFDPCSDVMDEKIIFMDYTE